MISITYYLFPNIYFRYRNAPFVCLVEADVT